MGLKVKSTVMCFFGGRRYRAGTVFELPEGVKPSADMEVVEEQEPAPQPKGKGGGKKGEGPSTFSEIAQKDGAAQQPKGAQGLV